MKHKVVLMQSYYQVSNPDRQKEIDLCHNQNANNPFFDEYVVIEKFRPTFNDFFSLTRKYPKHIIVIANTDITFNKTIEHIHSLNWSETFLCLALSRWDLKRNFQGVETLEHWAQSDSQDVWIFYGVVPVLIKGNISMGVPGCDNVIAHELNTYYSIYNPSKDIQCIHYHKDPARTYDKKPDGEIFRLPPPYHHVHPCNLSDII